MRKTLTRLTFSIVCTVACGNAALAAGDTALAARLDAERAQLRAERAAYPEYFKAAYARYPSIPAGTLESIAYVQSRWHHIVPAERQEDAHQHMPQAYGVMGLYHGGGFADQVADAAKLLDVPAARVTSDPWTNILAAAALLDRELGKNGKRGVTNVAGIAPALAAYAGFAPAVGEVQRFARDNFAFDVLDAIERGVDDDAMRVPQQAVDWSQGFDAATLERLDAAFVRVDALNDRVEAVGKSAAPPPSTDSTVGVTSDDYGPARWVASPYHSARSSYSAVAIHTTQGGYAGTISWFQSNPYEVSAHYVVRSSDGQVTQMVRENRAAHHVLSHNATTLGIEHEGFVDNPAWYTAALYNASAGIVRHFCAAYAAITCASAYSGPAHSGVVVLSTNVKIKGHQHFSGNTHTDPGINWNWAHYYSLLNNGSPPTNPPTNPPAPGRYWVDTFQNAPGYGSPASTTQTGTLYQGTNYVFCKTWGREIRSGSSYNHWWLKTDLDVGPAGQWVSAYYLSRWGNDEARDNNGAVIPDCAPAAASKYWVDTFAAAPGYGSPTSTAQTGTLNAGTNYVFCKSWGREIRNGSSYNHWWLRTDLDVGPAGQWVSAYYLSRWGNDEARDNNGAVIPDC